MLPALTPPGVPKALVFPKTILLEEFGGFSACAFSSGVIVPGSLSGCWIQTVSWVRARQDLSCASAVGFGSL